MTMITYDVKVETIVSIEIEGCLEPSWLELSFLAKNEAAKKLLNNRTTNYEVKVINVYKDTK